MNVTSFRENGDTSNIERVFLYKDSGATAGTEGDPFTGLAFNTALLNISTIADGEATANVDTSAATSSIEAVTTLGTYLAPTAGFVRIKEVDATNLPGLYELQFENARYAVSGARYLDITISGVADLAPKTFRVWLDIQSAQDIGLLYESTIATLTSATNWDMTLAFSTDDVGIGNLVTVIDATDDTKFHSTWVADLDQANNRIIVDTDAGWTAAVGDRVRIHNTPHAGYHANAQIAANTVPTYDQLVALIQLVVRSDAAIATDRNTELGVLNADETSGVGNYDNTTDSVEAIADKEFGVDVVKISGDSAAADALESYCDGTTPQPVNVTQINETAVNGTGIVSDKWRGA